MINRFIILTISLIALFIISRALFNGLEVETIQADKSNNSTQGIIFGRNLDTKNINTQQTNKSNEKYIYKWRDKNNTIIISSESPPPDVTPEVYPYIENGIPISGKSITNTTRGTKPISTKSIHENGSIADNPLQVYTPDGLKQLIQYTKDIGEQIELRGELLDSLSEEL